MFTKQVTLKLEAGSADQFTHIIESKSIAPLQDQKGFPDQNVVTLAPTPISRISKLVGFERGRRHLQPFVGPKEF